MAEINVENLIIDSAFPNSDHKRRLRERLFGQEAHELNLDELSAVAGGYSPENTPERPENCDGRWAEWPVPEDKPE